MLGAFMCTRVYGKSDYNEEELDVAVLQEGP